MKLFPLNKGLLWKEWRQNRWVFWVGFVVLCFPNIWYTLLQMLGLQTVSPFYFGQMWRQLTDAGFSMLTGQVTFFPFVAVAALGLGGFMLSQERTWANTLDFLVATPVSRREIIAAKFVTGLKMIGIVWGANLAFVLVMDAIFHSQFSGWMVLKYFCYHAVFLLASYSLGFFVAAFCGNILSTAVALIAINIAPTMVGSFLVDLVNRATFPNGLPVTFYRNVRHVQEALTLFHYSTLRVDKINVLQVICVLVVAVVLYLLTLFLFERNEMERNGRFLMFGDFWKLAQIIVPFGLAVIFAFGTSTSSDWFGMLFKFGILFIVLFLLIKLVRRVMRNFGFR